MKQSSQHLTATAITWLDEVHTQACQDALIQSMKIVQQGANPNAPLVKLLSNTKKNASWRHSEIGAYYPLDLAMVTLSPHAFAQLLAQGAVSPNHPTMDAMIRTLVDIYVKELVKFSFNRHMNQKSSTQGGHCHQSEEQDTQNLVGVVLSMFRVIHLHAQHKAPASQPSCHQLVWNTLMPHVNRVVGIASTAPEPLLRWLQEGNVPVLESLHAFSFHENDRPLSAVMATLEACLDRLALEKEVPATQKSRSAPSKM